jgi:hypothetical protein
MHCMRRGSHPPYPPFAILKLRFSAAPKGPKQESPGQRPGDPIRMRIRPALKGRNKILDQDLFCPSGRCYSQHPIQFPGRRPGLQCRCPYGARFKKRNFKTSQGGESRRRLVFFPPLRTAIFPAMFSCLSDGLYLPTQFRERHRDRQGVKSNMAVLNLIVVSIYILVFTDK